MVHWYMVKYWSRRLIPRQPSLKTIVISYWQVMISSFFFFLFFPLSHQYREADSLSVLDCTFPRTWNARQQLTSQDVIWEGRIKSQTVLFLTNKKCKLCHEAYFLVFKVTKHHYGYWVGSASYRPYSFTQSLLYPAQRFNTLIGRGKKHL